MVSVAYQGQTHFSAVWVYSGATTAYTDRTIEARTPTGTAFAILSAAADFLYLGSESRFDLAAFIESVAGAVGARTYEYSSSATAWTQFAPVYEYDFTQSGAEVFTNLVGWTVRAFSTTSPHVVASVPDTTVRYWIRISIASSTTAPTINQIWMRPYAAYCRYTDVFNLLQLLSDFSASTRPTADTVEDSINAAQSYIDYETGKSWRINWQREEFLEFNTAGSKLSQRDAFQFTRVEIWNGSTFEVRTEGRNNDYYLVPDRNMLMWSRYFLLPARFTAAAAGLNAWGFGEFLLPVRVSYLYGRNRFTDTREGGLIFDITRKLVAADVFLSHDYSALAVSGADKVSLSDKVRIWKEDSLEKLDRLKAWQVF